MKNVFFFQNCCLNISSPFSTSIILALLFFFVPLCPISTLLFLFLILAFATVYYFYLATCWATILPSLSYFSDLFLLLIHIPTFLGQGCMYTYQVKVNQQNFIYYTITIHALHVNTYTIGTIEPCIRCLAHESGISVQNDSFGPTNKTTLFCPRKIASQRFHFELLHPRRPLLGLPLLFLLLPAALLVRVRLLHHLLLFHAPALLAPGRGRFRARHMCRLEERLLYALPVLVRL